MSGRDREGPMPARQASREFSPVREGPSLPRRREILVQSRAIDESKRRNRNVRR